MHPVCGTSPKAIETAARLGLQGYLSINFLPNAVYEPVTCMELTLQAAQRYSFPSERPAFETAESEQVRDETHLTRIFQGCRERGFLIAVDDVGAGYACLKLPADFQPDLIAPWRARVGILMERSMSPFLPR